MSDPTEIRIHHTTLGDAISINGSWMNLSDWEEVAAAGQQIAEIAEDLRRRHEEEAAQADL
jgi:hypothetical protein